jgi:REP-associated tyrosine transposase
MGRDRYKILDPSFPYLCTCTIQDWFPLFMNPEIVQIIFDSLKFLQSEGLKIYAYVIMENHLHIIVQSDNSVKFMQRFKSFTATKIVDFMQNNFQQPLLKQFVHINKITHSKHKIWEEGYHPKVIEDYAIMQQKIEYIHNNPVRRGYIDDPTHWIYSSAKNYDGQSGLMDVIVDW